MKECLEDYKLLIKKYGKGKVQKCYEFFFYEQSNEDLL